MAQYSSRASHPGPQRGCGVRCGALPLALTLCAFPAFAQNADGIPPTAALDSGFVVESAEPAAERPEEFGPPQTRVSRLDAFIEFDSLLRSERFEEALPVGEQMLELTVQEFGERHRETATAHYRLANAQYGARLFDDAELNYLLAIEIFREIEGPYGESLLDPLLALGDNYYYARLFANAVSIYTEARNVNRRVFGLLNTDQVDIIDRVSASLLQLNRLEEAEEQQQAALNLIQRIHGEDSLEYLDALYGYARWLRQVNNFMKERDQYTRATTLIRQNFGRNSIHLVRPLRETANSFRAQRIGAPQGAQALAQAMDLAQSQENVDRLVMAELLRDFGDWQTAFVGPGGDRDGSGQYVQAWELLGNLENGDALREQWFGGLQFVLSQPVSQRGMSYAENAVTGYVQLRFDLDELGRPRNVEVVDSNPPGFKDDDIVRAVTRKRLRPHIVDGAVVAVEDLALRFNFRYQPDDVPN